MGVVHNPILGETFTAVRGRGALLNGQPICASAESDLASALVATEVAGTTDCYPNLCTPGSHMLSHPYACT